MRAFIDSVFDIFPFNFHRKGNQQGFDPNCIRDFRILEALSTTLHLLFGDLFASSCYFVT